MKDLLMQYIGTLCEIKTMDNELLLLGRVKAVTDTLSLSLDIVSDDGERIIKTAYGLPVKINLRNQKNGILVIGGRVYMANEDFLRISNISEYQNYERRGFFRVATHATGLACAVSNSPDREEISGRYPAQLFNISLSGVMFACDHVFPLTNQIKLLDVALCEEELPFSILCRIVGCEENRSLGPVYRCHFEQMEQKESDRLCRAIFSLQREIIKKRRSRS